MRIRAWLAIACLALAGTLFLASYPARAYLAQNETRKDMTARAQAIEAENGKLQDEAAKLQTDAEIESLARRDYNLAKPGEEVYALVPSPETTTTIPPAPPKRAPSRSFPERAWHWVTSIF